MKYGKGGNKITNHQEVQETQIIGAIHSASAIYANKTRKLNPAKLPSSPLKEIQILTNVDSFESLSPSAAACG